MQEDDNPVLQFGLQPTQRAELKVKRAQWGRLQAFTQKTPTRDHQMAVGLCQEESYANEFREAIIVTTPIPRTSCINLTPIMNMHDVLT